jgi:ATP-dependent RNA helicase RhlE
MSFESLGLAEPLLRAIKAENYELPTPIQQQSIPVGLEGRDLVGSAQTGTGKTAAFLLPILQRLDGKKSPSFRALVLVPTRELAEQVLNAARTYGQFTSVEATAVYGGVGMEPQTRALRNGTDIVVATPGRFLDHMRRGHVNSDNVEVLVLDEADRMLDMGFAPDVHKILDSLPKERQTMFFSATISSDVDRLARRALNDHTAVDIGERTATADGVEHTMIAIDKSQKLAALAMMLKELPKARTLVFARTKFGTDKVARYLKREDIDAVSMHGGKTQLARNKALDRFKTGKARVMVATDVAARGIDIDDIAMVVNFDVPNDAEIYVHRVGRTARAGAGGLAVTLLSPDEWLMVRDIEKFIDRSFTKEALPGFEPDVMPAQPWEIAAPPVTNKRTVTGRRGRARRR